MDDLKDYLQTFTVFIIFLILIPLIAFLRPESRALEQSLEKDFTVGILFTQTGETENYSIEDYVVGAVLSQMPADFEPEALKAQAVLARTYIQRRYESEKISPTSVLKGAILSDDTTLYQSFFTKAQAEEFYGEDYPQALEKVTKAVSEVSGEILMYENYPIVVAFHGLSSGETDSALTAWGEQIPYLQSVESENDVNIQGFESTLTFTEEEFSAKLCEKISPEKFRTTPKEKWFSLGDVCDGYVRSVNVCGEKILSDQFISLLGISSPRFTWDYLDGQFIFKSQGLGNLVGMSQYGANDMASKGSDYREILSHYFVGTEIQMLTGMEQ